MPKNFHKPRICGATPGVLVNNHSARQKTAQRGEMDFAVSTARSIKAGNNLAAGMVMIASPTPVQSSGALP